MINLRFTGAIREAINQRPPAWSDWRWQAEHVITDMGSLQQVLNLPQALHDSAMLAVDRYPLRVTPYYLALVQAPAFSDPILRQFLPAAAEVRDCDGAVADPFKERQNSPVPGLIQRYHDRAVFALQHPCPTLCRHCFRKHLWAVGRRQEPHEYIDDAVEYLGRQPQIREIIVSGSEPLMLEDDALAEIVARLSDIPHIEVIRIATRLLATLPQRITDDLCSVLAGFNPVWFVAHFNHPRELTEASAVACERLCGAGIPVVSQTVLLKGVNDDVATLRELFTGLLRLRVKPYYLFHVDPAAGAMHFRVSVDRGRRIMAALRATTSGLAIPTYAADIPGTAHKTALISQDFEL